MISPTTSGKTLATDSWPEDFVYISERQVSGILQQSLPRRRISEMIAELRVAASFGSFDIKLREQAEHNNIFGNIKAARRLISDQTGTINQPGNYWSARLQFEILSVPVLLGFQSDEENNTEGSLAALYSIGHSEDYGRTFIALFGSEYNLLSNTATRAREGARHMSDISGLYHLFDQFTSLDDPSVSPSYARSSEASSKTRPSFPFEVASTIYELSTRRPTIELNLIAKSFFHEKDFTFLATYGQESYDHAIIGTPLWASRVPPSP